MSKLETDPFNRTGLLTLSLKQKNNVHEKLSSTLYKCHIGEIIRFEIGANLHGFNIKLFTNAPLSKDDVFDRKKFKEIVLKKNALLPFSLDFYDLETYRAGAFEFFYEYSKLTDESDKVTVDEFFCVEPSLYIDKKQIPLDAVCMHTVLTKSLGPIHEWKPRLEVSTESGFNFIHFTPVQALGASESSYSVCDQLKLNEAAFKDSDDSEADLKDCIDWLEYNAGALSLTDVVWNHTAHNSVWLDDHPEAGYNLVNSPHLIPAFELDEIICRYSENIVRGCQTNPATGLPLSPIIKSQSDIDLLMDVLCFEVIPQAKLWEYFVLDVDSILEKFVNLVKGKKVAPMSHEELLMNLEHRVHHRIKLLSQTLTPKFGVRFGTEIDLDVAEDLFYVASKTAQNESPEAAMKRITFEFRKALEIINLPIYEVYNEDIDAGITNIRNSAKHQRLDEHGPNMGPLSHKYPLSYSYFTRLKASNLPSFEKDDLDKATKEYLRYDDILNNVDKNFVVANNGWIWGGSDPEKDFALADSKVYWRREVIIWGDCVKLRYGEKPADSPFLWKHMEEYTKFSAKFFHGLRIDNCHSTPIHVAQHLLDIGRDIRPNLYVVAELFTGSEHQDNIFVKQLSIDSLVREAMSAPDCRELGRLVHRYGGKPIGSFPKEYLGKSILLPKQSHALFVDTTHDNDPPIIKRTVFDMLSNAAIVSMSACGVASNRGYDEFVPHYIDVVNEYRHYASYTNRENSLIDGEVNMATGMIFVRKILNDLHVELSEEGFSEIYVEQVNADVIYITRHNPKTRQSVILAANSAFKTKSEHQRSYCTPLTIVGNVDEVVLHASIKLSPSTAKLARRRSLRSLTEMSKNEFEKHPKFVNGLTDVQLNVKNNISHDDPNVTMFQIHPNEDGDGYYVDIDSESFAPGSIFILRTSPREDACKAIEQLSKPLDLNDSLKSAINELNLLDLNIVLYRCDEEERDDDPDHHGSYNVPNYGTLVYAGLQGQMSSIDDIVRENALGHPMCDNLRDGLWMVNHTVQRLKSYKSTAKLGEILKELFEPLKSIPFFLVPCYFALVISQIYDQCLTQAYTLMSSFVQTGTKFIKDLSLVSLQMCAALKSAPCRYLRLPAQNDKDGTIMDLSMSMAAGLPHFCSGFMRAWGRDTFISLRGLLLVTGRFQDARNLIVGFAATMRHGLIPNLLDASRNSRFNCRDAVWFWLQSVQDYCSFSEEGSSFLDTPITRLYPTNNRAFYKETEEQRHTYIGNENTVVPLKEIIFEILSEHAKGIHFEEWGAGDLLDRNMSKAGFQIDINFDKKTGLILGGNSHNCGTWMDKMGESEKAGNKGKPGSPRDGADIEIIGLLKSTLRWICELNKKDASVFGHDSVNLSDSETLSFEDWNSILQENFEKCFYIPENEEDDFKYALDTKNVHRRGIYKDTYGSEGVYTDYQLRPNICIAMSVAPEMFDEEHARVCLSVVEDALLGPLGIRTLDPLDWAYRGDYDNSNDGTDPSLAKGLNYHQGPEWIWPVGYFLRAKFIFHKRDNAEKEMCIKSIYRILNEHQHALQHSHWRGLHELTNSNGKECHHSCPTQAWSSSCLLDCLWDIASN